MPLEVRLEYKTNLTFFLKQFLTQKIELQHIKLKHTEIFKTKTRKDLS